MPNISSRDKLNEYYDYTPRSYSVGQKGKTRKKQTAKKKVVTKLPALTTKHKAAVILYVYLNTGSNARRSTVVEKTLDSYRMPKNELYKKLKEAGYIWDDGEWRKKKR